MVESPSKIAVRRLGITKIRLTGGEPLLRRGLPGLVNRLHAIDPDLELDLTGFAVEHGYRLRFIEQAWRACIAGKGPGHAINSAEFCQPDRPMSAIGG